MQEAEQEVSMQETEQVKEVLEILDKVKPDLQKTPQAASTSFGNSGSGWATESIFTFSKSCNYYWIVIVRHTFAFKPITPEWIGAYSNLILSSPGVHVEWNRHQKIIEWAVKQDKEKH